MQFTTTAKELHDKLRSISDVVPRKSALPALGYVRADLIDGYLHLTATDLEVTIKTDLFLEPPYESGSILIPTKATIQLLKTLGKNEVVVSTEKGARLVIQSGVSHFELETQAVEDYPQLLEVPGEETYEFAYWELEPLLSKALPFVSLDELRPQLCGIRVEIGSHSIRFVATDGHRLTCHDMRLDYWGDGTSDTDTSFILPREAARLALKTLKANARKERQCGLSLSLGFGTVQPCEQCKSSRNIREFVEYCSWPETRLDKRIHYFCENCALEKRTRLKNAKLFRLRQTELPVNQVCFSIGDVQIISRVIEGKYPNYSSVIPDYSQSGKILRCNREQLAQVISRVGNFSNETSRQVRFLLNGCCRIDAEDVEKGRSGGEDFAGTYEGDEIRIGFNADYVLSGLNAIEQTEIEWRFDKPTSASVLRPIAQSDSEDFLCLLMPVRLT
jgi:DNA polymerase III sliding clamp (beta) subunit (PCNA family)